MAPSFALRLTKCLNLSALVTCHSLYVVLTTLQRAVFLVNSRLTQFTATTLRWHPFFRSYGARLPSSLTMFLSRAWVYSTHPPVSVCGTVEPWEHKNKFLGGRFMLIRFGTRPPRPLAGLALSIASQLHNARVMFKLNQSRCRNIKPACPSSTPFGLDLGSD